MKISFKLVNFDVSIAFKAFWLVFLAENHFVTMYDQNPVQLFCQFFRALLELQTNFICMMVDIVWIFSSTYDCT